jgi:hypothetical protein
MTNETPKQTTTMSSSAMRDFLRSRIQAINDLPSLGEQIEASKTFLGDAFWGITLKHLFPVLYESNSTECRSAFVFSALPLLEQVFYKWEEVIQTLRLVPPDAQIAFLEKIAELSRATALQSPFVDPLQHSIFALQLANLVDQVAPAYRRRAFSLITRNRIVNGFASELGNCPREWLEGVRFSSHLLNRTPASRSAAHYTAVLPAASSNSPPPNPMAILQEILQRDVTVFRPREQEVYPSFTLSLRDPSDDLAPVGQSSGFNTPVPFNWSVLKGIDRKAENERSECIICRDNAKVVVIVPCRHMCMCVACAKAARPNTCPLCRAVVESGMVIFD